MAKRRSIVTSRVKGLMDDNPALRTKVSQLIKVELDPEFAAKIKEEQEKLETAANALNDVNDSLDFITNPHYGQDYYQGKWLPKELVRQLKKIAARPDEEWAKYTRERLREGLNRKRQTRPVEPFDYDKLTKEAQAEIESLIRQEERDERWSKRYYDDKTLEDNIYESWRQQQEAKRYWFEEWFSRLKPMFDEAVRRMNKLEEAELSSRALEKLKNIIYEDGFTSIYDVRKLQDMDVLRKYNSVVQDFLSDNGSTIEGAVHEMAIEAQGMYRNAFGKQFVQQYGLTWDPAVINSTLVGHVWELYRKIEELPGAAALIGRRGEDGVYGSDNVVAFIYDLYQDGRSDDEILEMMNQELDAFANTTREVFYTKKQEVDTNSFNSTSQEFNDFLSRLEW